MYQKRIKDQNEQLNAYCWYVTYEYRDAFTLQCTNFIKLDFGEKNQGC